MSGVGFARFLVLEAAWLFVLFCKSSKPPLTEVAHSASIILATHMALDSTNMEMYRWEQGSIETMRTSRVICLHVASTGDFTSLANMTLSWQLHFVGAVDPQQQEVKV